MENNNLVLLTVALLPAIALCIYIFKKDRVEREPLGLLAILLVCGVLICFPAVEIEKIMQGLIDENIAETVFYEGQEFFVSENAYFDYVFWIAFVGVALVEEALKWIAMVLVTRKNKNFNCLFDGIVYAVFVSLGFAAYENILYVFSYGWDTAVMRMLTAVPAHTFFAIFMGYYYSSWHLHDVAKQQEKRLVDNGVISKPKRWISGTRFMVLSILIPTVVHGFYDYCCMRGDDAGMQMFYIFLIFLYIYCFRKVSKQSKADASDTYLASNIILKKYPQLRKDAE